MAAPSGSPPAIPSASPPPSLSPPSTTSPPPAASPPPTPQPSVPADPPTPSTPSPPISGSPPLALPPPPTVPASPPPTVPASPPIVPASPPPVSPPPASPPPVSPPPPPITASPPPPSAGPPPIVATPPAPSPPPPSSVPPPSSPPTPALPTPSPPAIVPSPPPAGSPPPPVRGPPPSPARPSPPTPPQPSPPAPDSPPPSSPPAVDSPPPPETQAPSSPSTSPPSTNVTQPTPSPPPPGILPGPPLSPPRPPSSDLTPPSPTLPPPTTNASVPLAPSTPVPPIGPNSTKTSTPTAGDINSSGGGGVKTGTAVGIGVVVSLAVLSLVGIIVWSVKKRKKHAGGFSGSYVNVLPSPFQSSQMSESPFQRSPTPDMKNSSGSYPYSPSDPGLGYSKSLFTYEELSQITNGFSSQNLLGEGGFGCVYKGHLPDGREVAVKQLKDGGGQGEREFRAEVEIISRIHHRHLVSLVGYCISENQRLLVYDYVPNNTLHYHLHGVGKPVMDWATRLKVALGAARGLAYLHEDCHPRVIHRDIKSSNILLDFNFEAQVSDFGLAKLAMDANTHVTTRVMGTFGYLAPEYASSGKLTDKSDVFSFGVVLLELVTGRKPVDTSQPLGDESLVEWARPLMSRALETGDFEDLPDPRLEKNYNESEVFRMIEVAAACVRHSAAMRPRMGQVVRALDGLGDSMDLHNGTKPGQSELFNSAQQSAEIRLFQRMAFGSQDYSSDFSRSSWKSRRDL